MHKGSPSLEVGLSDNIKFSDSRILECGYCGNRTPHLKVCQYEHARFFDEFETMQVIEPYTWVMYACGTCGGLNIYGDYYGIYRSHGHDFFARTRLHPRASLLLPADYMMSPADPIPTRIMKAYEDIWPLRHRTPTAFIGQIRRLLEFVCEDQCASGKSLFSKLSDLTSRGVLPGHFANITDLLRVVGNMGAHAEEDDLSVWDAELIDDFFRPVIDYVYIAPAKIQRMQQRLSMRTSDLP
jgi:hypothetical protein